MMRQTEVVGEKRKDKVGLPNLGYKNLDCLMTAKCSFLCGYLVSCRFQHFQSKTKFLLNHLIYAYRKKIASLNLLRIR